MAAVRRHLYVLGGNDLDYNNDRILVRHIDSYNMDVDQWTRCTFSLLTGGCGEDTRPLLGRQSDDLKGIKFDISQREVTN